jgi:hypothetical protein
MLLLFDSKGDAYVKELVRDGPGKNMYGLAKEPVRKHSSPRPPPASLLALSLSLPRFLYVRNGLMADLDGLIADLDCLFISFLLEN